jgi:hypothetical protein
MRMNIYFIHTCTYFNHGNRLHLIIRGLIGTFNDVKNWTEAGWSYTSPSSFIALMERHCVLALAQVTLMHGTVLPSSLLLLHAAAPGPSALLTCRLRLSFDNYNRNMLRTVLAKAGNLLSSLLATPRELGKWVRCRRPQGASGGGARAQTLTEGEQHEVDSFCSRALVLLLCLGINGERQQAPGAAAGDLMRAVHGLSASGAPKLPKPLGLMAARLAAPPAGSRREYTLLHVQFEFKLVRNHALNISSTHDLSPCLLLTSPLFCCSAGSL